MNVRVFLSLIIIIGVLVYGPGPAYSQQGEIQNLVVNGGFEGGFQEDFGVGYGWGGFSNGNAVVGWKFDDWEAVVVDGNYSQRIEIRDARSLDRYGGIYQIIPVVPGEQYKLTIKGLIRSSEGDVGESDYGYRLQYAIDHKGGTAWELVNESAWTELPWDEQPMTEPSNGAFQIDTYETTVTAQGDELTLFIRGWKKWINNGSGVFNLDEISLVGSAPEGFQAPVAEAASVESAEQESPQLIAVPQAQVSEHDADMPAEETEPQPETAPAPEEPETATEPTPPAPAVAETMPQTGESPQTDSVPQPERAQLPVSGQGDDDSNYTVIFGGALLLILVSAALVATVRRHNLTE